MILATKEWVIDLVKKVINKGVLKNVFNKSKLNNTLYANNYPLAQTGAIEVWVDGTNGNDSTGDGTKENPFKTLNYLRTIIPHTSTDSTLTIHVTGNFPAVQYFGNFGGRYFIIYMEGNPTFYKLHFYRTTYIEIRGDFTINYNNNENTAYGSALDLNAVNVWYTPGTNGLIITGRNANNSRGIYLSIGASFSTPYDPAAYKVTIKNCWQGVMAEFLSNVYIAYAIGSGNTTGLVAGCGAHIYYMKQSGMSTSTYANGKIN